MGLWVIFVIATIALGSVVGAKQHTGGNNAGETARVEQIISDAHFPDQAATEHVLVTSPSGPLDRAAATAALVDAAARMRALPGVAGVDSPVLSPDGTAMMLNVRMAGDPRTSDQRVQPLMDTTAAVARDHSQLRVEEVGDASLNKELGDKINSDFHRAEFSSVPVTLLILLVAFGALIAAGVPVLLGLSAVGAAIGLSALTSYLVPVQDTTSSVILLIGLAVGVDYSLFYLKREREERAAGRGHLDAVEIAAATSGHAVVVSGIAVIVAMAGMFLAQDDIFTSFAIGSILVVAVSVLGSLTVLPALLAKLGRWVDRPRIPFLWRLTAARQGRDGAAATPRFWSAVLRPALRFPAAALIVSAGVLVALGLPMLQMSLKLPGIGDLGANGTPVVQAYTRMTTAFPSTGSDHVVVVKASPAQRSEVDAALTALSDRTAVDPLFAHDQRPRQTVSPDGSVTLLTIGTPYAVNTAGADQSLNRLRGDLLPATVGQIPGAQYGVTGEIAGTTDYSNHIRDTLPIVIAFVLGLTFVVMLWTFRSVVIAATAIGLNMLSVWAAYGILTLLFQHTFAQRLLDFNSNGAIVSWLPLFLFVVLFGLSMDYHVFVVSRIREGVHMGLSTRDAVKHGIVRSAGVVTSAAAVMVGVFAVFGSLSTLDLKQLGVGLAVAILIDATLIRAVVLPSLMILLGRANWWVPRFLRPRGGAHRVGAQPVEPQRIPQPVGTH
jgi:RND superfamily putative drug exporter